MMNRIGLIAVPHTKPFRRRFMGAGISATMTLATTTWSGATCAQQAQDSSLAHPAQWPSLPPVALVSPETEAFVGDLLGRMSLEDKIGQMVQADIASVTPEDVQRYRLGSVLAGGLSAPGGDLHTSPATWLRMVRQYRAAALAGAGAPHPPIPILFGIDAVHGNAKVPGATIFPHNVGLGATHDPELVRRIGEATAQEVAAIGIDWAFAPTVAVARDPRWGRAYESYSDDPTLVAAYASAMVTGLQGRLSTADYLARGHVLSSAKHFIGDGGTQEGRDQGDTRVPEENLRDIHGPGYRAAISAGVGTIMASYNAWNGEKMHANTSLLTGVLKQRWQFGGFVIGDWDAQEEIPGCTKFSCADAVNAGIDMVMAPDSWKQFYASLLAQARQGTVSAARINDAVRRILRVKAAAGLIGPGARPPAGSDFAALGSAAHRALAREAVRKSLVLLKTSAGLLPIERRRNVLVVGDAADSVGEQCGGWTVDWQGANHSNGEMPGATSIYAGIKAVVEQGGGTAQLSRDGSFTHKPDVAIVVFGEHPYAEFEGDRENLMLPDLARVRAILARLRAHHIPIVSVLLSGRPLWVNPEMNLSDAFVAAWLPGSEGEGVADVLFRSQPGETPHDFTGRLSFPWPATAMPVRYTAQGTASGVLFARFYGLTAAQPGPQRTLPEDPAIPSMWSTENVFYAFGHVIAPYSIYVSDAQGQVRLTRRDQVSPSGATSAAGDADDVTAAWSGKEVGTWSIGDTQKDLAGATRDGEVLSLTYRVVQSPSAPMRLGMQCGEGCAGWLDVTKNLQHGGGSDWQTLRIPLACYAARGADMRHVSVPFALQSRGRATIAIRAIAFAPRQAGDGCPAG